MPDLITIVVTPNHGPACSGYFYENDNKIVPGQAVSVENADLHTASGMVKKVTMAEAKKAELEVIGG